jgi:SAM-dependent methyltransferase
MASGTYHHLADSYDHFFDAGPAFTAARRKILGKILPRVTSACDLCCGTGTLAILLAQRGIRMYAADQSAAMCRHTRTKARQAGVRITVSQQDMRGFRLPEPVDLITCEYDALNHVPRKTDLLRVLRSVARNLKPGGHFAFDVNNRPAFEQIWAHTWMIDQEPAVLVMQGRHVAGTDRAQVDVHWFVRRGHAWRRHHECIQEVCWSEAEIRAAVASAGLTEVGTWDAAPFFRNEFTRPGNRTFWLVQK